MLKRLKVGSSVYSVEMKSPIDVAESYCGFIHYNKRKILLDKSLHGAELAETLMHEVVHGIDREIRLHLDEDSADRLARMMIQVIQDNPKLVEIIEALNPVLSRRRG